MQLPDFLTQAHDGKIRLTDHRIGLYHLVQHYNEGESAEMLACRYPSVPLSLVHKALAFYLENQSEVDDYVAACSTAMKVVQHGAKEIDWSALRRRLASQQLSPPEVQVR